MNEKWDVIVIGGGPGGALAAKKCAENCYKTLLLEKKKMPRDKCCSGMVMGVWGQDIIKQEFGEYPEDVLQNTTPLFGYAMHVPGASVKLLDIATPATWRKTLDAWMCEKAKEAGAKILDSAHVINVDVKNDTPKVTYRKDDQIIELESEYVIGADGANSVVRKSVFPEIKPNIQIGYRLCYETRLDLPEKRFNIFQTIDTQQLFFVHDKGNYMLLEGVALKGRVKATIDTAKAYLTQHHGFNTKSEPIWKDGCIEAPLYKELTKGVFKPARNKVLIIGDAAGLNIPVTGEGLATSLKGGLDAANSIITAKKTHLNAEAIYLESVEKLLNKYHDILIFGKRIKTAAHKNDAEEFSQAILESWDYSLKLF
jgi:menaquinone-9 beta-reductase